MRQPDPPFGACVKEIEGTAAALVHQGIGAVAAMQFAVSDTAAIKFARGFYAAISHGRAVDEAVRSGRIAILGTAHTLEWITPVLYVRGVPQVRNCELGRRCSVAEARRRVWSCVGVHNKDSFARSPEARGPLVKQGVRRNFLVTPPEASAAWNGAAVPSAGQRRPRPSQAGENPAG